MSMLLRSFICRRSVPCPRALCIMAPAPLTTEPGPSWRGFFPFSRTNLEPRQFRRGSLWQAANRD
jgi:hypothetical protein